MRPWHACAGSATARFIALSPCGMPWGSTAGSVMWASERIGHQDHKGTRGPVFPRGIVLPTAKQLSDMGDRKAGGIVAHAPALAIEVFSVGPGDCAAADRRAEARVLLQGAKTLAGPFPSGVPGCTLCPWL